MASTEDDVDDGIDLASKHNALCKLHVDVVNELEESKRTIQRLSDEKEQNEHENKMQCINTMNDITNKYQQLLQQTEQITNNLTNITLQNEKLTDKNQRLQSLQDSMSANIMSLTNKIHSLTKSEKALQHALTSQNKISQQKMNELIEKYKQAKVECSDKVQKCKQNEEKMVKMQQQIQTMLENEKSLKNQLKSQSMQLQMASLKQSENMELASKQLKIVQWTKQNGLLEKECKSIKNRLSQREKILDKISAALASCSCFKSNDSMSIIHAVQHIIHKYETYAKTNTNVVDLQEKLKNIQRQIGIIHSETLQSIEKWKVFGLQRSNDKKNSKVQLQPVVVTNVDMNQCVADTRSLNLYFAQALRLYQQRVCVHGVHCVYTHK